ncbi:MAG: hypothetical protein CAPSK01_004864 [Candidatus Accumulibacter vicinus]|uniref:Uncharacterized protein n=1 Tax=Candidatus Accumulibacter vicinus TaxID=2954382 RepID=A0A084XU78_9PROT|nr:MAG: hypothetical protein CAPSK01_004864 [Candidatus Accumulibacter vicinus]
MPVEHLHETGVDTLRETRVRFDQWPQPLDRRGVDVGNHVHGVRIAHADSGHGPFLVGDPEWLQKIVAVADEGNLVRGEHRHPHVDGH